MQPARTALSCIALSGCMSLGCTSSSPAKDPAPAKAEPAEAKTEAPVEPAAPTSVTEAEARAVFEAWVRAQTDKDFEAYARLYAPDFKGIKRNGARTRRLEREPWLSAREKQFARGYSIRATGLKLEPADGREPGAMTATFTQRWVTPNYADVGPKELVIARRGEVVAIAHEEMLSSHVTRRKGRSDSPMLVLGIGEARYAVLGLGRPEWAAEGEQAPSLLDDDTIRGPLALERVDEAMPGLVGRQIDVKEPDGSTCRAKIEGLELVGRAGFSSYQEESYWEEEPTKAEALADLWEEMSSETLLLGRLDACTGRFAVSVDAAEFAEARYFEQADAVEAGLTEAMRQAFGALPQYAAEQKSYEDDLAESGYRGEGEPPERWSDLMGMRTSQLWTSGEERLAFTSVSVGEGCGDWTGSLWALWTVGEGDALELVASGSESGDFSGASSLDPRHVVRWHDTLWVITTSELYEIRPQPKGNATLVYATEPMYFGCSC